MTDDDDLEAAPDRRGCHGEDGFTTLLYAIPVGSLLLVGLLWGRSRRQ
ncbi:hypothetical protein ACYJ1Y_03380 [Natrialbaceae archaeon A-gly3]